MVTPVDWSERGVVATSKAESVEAVATEPGPARRRGQGQGEGLGRQGVVEGGVEAGHLRPPGPDVVGRRQPGQGRGLVRGANGTSSTRSARRLASTRAGATWSGPPWTTR